MPRSLSLKLLLAILAFSGFGASIQTARGQARESASRVSEISVFVEYESLATDYGEKRDNGIIVGADYTRYFRGLILPSFEVRGTYAGKGENVGEETILFGGRADLHLRALGRFHPYVNVLFGLGQINFTRPQITTRGLYVSDNSVVVNYGGGLDVLLPSHFSGQVEYEQQHWNLGGAEKPFILTPSSLNVGLRYRIPFRPRNHR